MCGAARVLNPNNPTAELLILILKCNLPPYHVLDSSGKPMLQHCMQAAICAPSQVPWDKGPCYTSRFSHISAAISHCNRSPIWLFHWYLLLQLIWGCPDLSTCPCCPDWVRGLWLIALCHIEVEGQTQIQEQVLCHMQVGHRKKCSLDWATLLFNIIWELCTLCNGY